MSKQKKTAKKTAAKKTAVQTTAATLARALKLREDGLSFRAMEEKMFGAAGSGTRAFNIFNRAKAAAKASAKTKTATTAKVPPFSVRKQLREATLKVGRTKKATTTAAAVQS